MRARALEDVRADVNAAIDRLLKGVPTIPALLQRALAGKLEINVSTVATESGRSRTYFGHRNCPLPDVRRRILELRTSSARVVAYKDLIKRLLAKIAELEGANRAKDSALAAMIVAAAQNGLTGAELSDGVVDYRRNRMKTTSKHRLR